MSVYCNGASLAFSAAGLSTHFLTFAARPTLQTLTFNGAPRPTVMTTASPASIHPPIQSSSIIPVAQGFTSAPLKRQRPCENTTSPSHPVKKTTSTIRETKAILKNPVPIAAAHDYSMQPVEQVLQYTNLTNETQVCRVHQSRHHSTPAAVRSAISGPSVPQVVRPSIKDGIHRIMHYLMKTKKARRKRTPRMIQLLNEGRREGKRIFCTRAQCAVSCTRGTDFIRHMQIIHDDRKEICIICGDAVSHMNMRHYCGPNCRASLVERLRRLRSVMPTGDPLQALGLMKERRRR